MIKITIYNNMSKTYFITDHHIDVNYKCEVIDNRLDVYKTNKNIPRIIKIGQIIDLNPDYYYFFKSYTFDKIFTYENILSDLVIIKYQNSKYVVFNKYYIMEFILPEDFDRIEVDGIMENGCKETGYYQFKLYNGNEIIYNCYNPFGDCVSLLYRRGDYNHIYGEIVDTTKM